MSEEAAPVAEGQVAEAAPVAEGQVAETPAWYDGASDETVGYIQNKGWQEDPMKAISSYQELEKFRGVSEDKLIMMPKEGETMDAVWNKLGRPESAEKYDLGLPPEMPVDDARMGMAMEAAYKAGLSNDQIKALITADSEYNVQAQEHQAKELSRLQEVDVNDLKKEWGEAYEERAELGRRFIKDNLPDGVDKIAMLSAIEDAVGTKAMLQLFGNAGIKSINLEDKAPDTSGSRPYGYTREQATADKQTLMTEIQADPARLDNYNKGIGTDLEKMKQFNSIILK